MAIRSVAHRALGIPVLNYVDRSLPRKADRALGQAAEMMDFFERTFGSVPVRSIRRHRRQLLKLVCAGEPDPTNLRPEDRELVGASRDRGSRARPPVVRRQRCG